MALPKRGARLTALLTGRRSYWTTYTMRSAQDGETTFPLVVVCRHAAGRRGRHGIDYRPLPWWARRPLSCPRGRSPLSIGPRFGIESGYRQMNAVRAPTTSRDPALRLLLVVLAFLLINLWDWLKACLVAATPRHARALARAWLTATFRLDRLCDLLVEAVKTLYQRHKTLRYPFPCTGSPKL